MSDTSSVNGSPPEATPLPPETAVLVRCYEELQARDGRAERKAWAWQRLALVLAVALMGLGVWDHLDKRGQVQPFVQLVQVTEDGKAVMVGTPVDLLSYEPQDGQWLDMLGEWVRRVRWRGTDPVLAKQEWAWAYLHTCGAATQQLRQLEAREKPFELGKKTVSVVLKSLTRTLAPLSYQAIWEETILEPAQQARTVMMTGTFTVSRYQPQSQAHVLSNRLGLCISALDISPHPSSLLH